ncbi:Taurine catabolism dioxygenase TauD/TfdA [Kalmanozyma brasiliensis GHG001]|uniref:Taurine catabolism dioxygenase TauD n=1 Tax=Kalmanozyma brasiliensis (strain GHG001) TaxID=1365824 RepID=V5EV50_KALBG|nr:Taurine catabolism dioxygenase TauD/TfdA [Kalmanozyma brasiliensis GHG001]EST09330.1 Taurine catabolism dioxygenase TauD/TfdA [Kalmanozyma brasiliensis GHG001]
MLSTLPPNADHFSNKSSGDGDGGSGGFSASQIAAQRSLKSSIQELTSGQHDADASLLTPYSELPKEITGPTVWDAASYKGAENAAKWVHTFNEHQISQLESAAQLWLESGRELGEIERSTFPLPSDLVATLTELRQRLITGHGFYLFKGLPTKRWGNRLSAIAYLGLGSYLGNVVSQNRYGHILGHVKDLGEDPTAIDKVRIYRTNARQFFHTDSSGGIVGLLCLHKAVEGGESDIVSSHAVWNHLQANRPDVAELLASNIWHFDRKGEVSTLNGTQNGWVTRPIVHLRRGQPANRLILTYDPYYLKSIQRHVDAGLIPQLSDKQKEAMQVLEDTAKELSLHMVLDVGDIQFVSDVHVLHARTEYKDPAPPAPRRHLYRLWLAVPTAEGGWENAYPDNGLQRRGGIQVNDTKPTYPLDGE